MNQLLRFVTLPSLRTLSVRTFLLFYTTSINIPTFPTIESLCLLGGNSTDVTKSILSNPDAETVFIEAKSLNSEVIQSCALRRRLIIQMSVQPTSLEIAQLQSLITRARLGDRVQLVRVYGIFSHAVEHAIEVLSGDMDVEIYDGHSVELYGGC